MQGAAAARPWHERAGCSFSTVVDQDNRLSRLFGFKIVPNLFVLDPDGVLAVKWYSFWIDRDEEATMLPRIVSGDFAPFERGNPAGPGVAGRPLPAGQPQLLQELVETRTRLGAELLSQGRQDEAVREWRQALRWDPANFTLRKQLWVLLYPDKFYPELDKEWQKQRLAADLAEEEAEAAADCGPDGCVIS